MKKTRKVYFAFLLITTAILSNPAQLHSQGGECVMIEWSENYGGALNDWANDVIQTADGGFVAVGFSRSNSIMLTGNQGKSDFWIIKVDSLGEPVWQHSYGGSENDVASGVVQSPDGGYMVAGGTVSFDVDVVGNHGAEDVWVLKLNPMGEMVWSKTYGGSLNERAESIELTNDGNFILAGYSESYDDDVEDNNGDFDYWILKIDISGNLLWENNFGGSLSDFAFDAKPTADGGYLMVGSTFSNNGDVSSNNGFYDYWVVKTDANGNVVWESNFGGTLEERAYSLVVTPDDGAIIVGTSNSPDFDVSGNNGSYDYWIIRIDASGNLVWSKNYGGASEDRAYGITALEDGQFLAVGFTFSNGGDVGNNFGSADAWLIKFGPDGNLTWEKNLGGTKEDRINAIIQTDNKGFLGAGFSASNDNDLPDNFGDRDLWLISLSPDSLSIDIGNDTTLCFNDNLLLELEKDDITYLWSDGSTAPFLTVVEEGEYWLEVDLFGCKARDSIMVDYLTQNAVSLGNDTILCEGESLLLSFNIPGAAFEWRDGSSGNSFLIETSGNYWVSVLKEGCEQRDTVTADFTTVEIGFEEEAFICEGEELLLDVERPQASYRWQDNSNDPFYSITGPGTYWVKVTQGGCSNSDSILVDFQDGPDSIFVATSFICEEEGVWFDATFPGATYLWQDGSTDQRLKAVEPGVYKVEVNINGCIFEEETFLKSCEQCLYIPNIFSPNNDGINDVFSTYPTCELLGFHALIFDRWGNIVFENFDPNDHWDGMHEGQKVGLGTYVYLITYGLNNNGTPKPQQRTGTVTLIH